jgi:hypothetical protein
LANLTDINNGDALDADVVMANFNALDTQLTLITPSLERGRVAVGTDDSGNYSTRFGTMCLHFVHSGTLAAGETRYLGVIKEASSAEKVGWRMPRACVQKYLRAECETAPGVGQTLTFTLQEDGNDTDVTCTISGTDTEGSDTTHSNVSATVANMLEVKVVASAGAASSANVRAFVMCSPT